MDFPNFFEDAPTLSVRDPLAVFLGASPSGVITYGYMDVVKLAGHSCPTVAGAYLMVRSGLAELYGDDMPERGGIEVHLRGGRDEGTTGVTATVAMLLTGAAPETGFAGVGPGSLHARRDLLHFGAPIDGIMALRRRDTGQGVVLDMNMATVPQASEMQDLMPKAVTGRASADEQARFGALWQDRVARMLLDHADDPALVRARAWGATPARAH